MVEITSYLFLTIFKLLINDHTAPQYLASFWAQETLPISPDDVILLLKAVSLLLTQL